ncbi:MAG: HAD family phosphatase [Pseudomonadota bacterium]
MKPGLIIFDCDGVLVDTEPVANAVMVDLLGAEGFKIDVAGAMERFVGKSMRSVKAEVEATLGRRLPDDWPDRVRAATLARFHETGVEAIPGVAGLIHALDRAGIALCVASSGSVAKMTMTLGATGLYDRLKDVLFTADAVSRGKPAPDLFLHAARSMGHDPRDAVVIEDSRFGVEAAIAAGMRAFGYVAPGHSQPGRLAALGAEEFTAMSELHDILELEAKT